MYIWLCAITYFCYSRFIIKLFDFEKYVKILFNKMFLFNIVQQYCSILFNNLNCTADTNPYLLYIIMRPCLIILIRYGIGATSLLQPSLVFNVLFRRFMLCLFGSSFLLTHVRFC